MSVIDFRVQDFRNITQARLQPGPGLNLILGPNASGKTSLLESIHLLGRGRSFRSVDARELVRRGAGSTRVVATVATPDGGSRVLGLERGGRGWIARLAGEPVRSLSELAAELPVLLLDASSHRLLEGGPGQRRRYLDWGVFQSVGEYLLAWRRFALALRHRNAALRQGAPSKLIHAWDADLVQAAEAVHGARQRYLVALRDPLAAVARHLLQGAELSLDYRRGWPDGACLRDQLASGLDQDRRLGHTRWGPQRCDLRVLLDGQRAVDRVSRGQQKLVAAALVLAQAQVYGQDRGRACVLLVDDLPAELDRTNAQRLWDALRAVGAQLFVTAIEFRNPALGNADRAYAVEAGTVRKML